MLKKSAARRSLDNITVLLLGFKNFKKSIRALNEGSSLLQLKEKHLLEKKNMQNEIDHFECFDIDMEDLNIL